MSKKFNNRGKYKKCEVCDECIAMGEGDHLYGKTNKLVIGDMHRQMITDHVSTLRIQQNYREGIYDNRSR